MSNTESELLAIFVSEQIIADKIEDSCVTIPLSNRMVISFLVISFILLLHISLNNTEHYFAGL